MSDTSWGCQSLEECATPTWEHALGQLVVAAAMWLVFVVIGICWTSLAPFIDFDFRSTFGRYQYGLASAGLGAGLCLTGIYMMQCLTYLHRSIMGFVDPLLHAFEMLGTLISLLDICARWAYMCCDGFWQLMAHSFNGVLIVDCLVSTATVGLGITAGPPGEEKRTWWSMSFLASIHVFRCLGALAKGDTGRSNSNLKRQILYATMTVLNGMYLFASVIMTLEILGPRPGTDESDKLPGQENPWTMADGLVWAVSLFTLMGNNSRNATNFLGQVVGIVGLLIALGQIVKIAPICINAVTGSGSFVGRYPIESRHHRNHDGHTIILGSPTAKTLIEFLFEYYHLNHFTGGLDFEREASDVVVFLEDAKVLAHLRRLLDLKDASLFRSRVFLIKGTAFQHYDCRRACAAHAKRVVAHLARTDVRLGFAPQSPPSWIMESQAQACGVLKYTKICRHWRSGSCFRGSSCDFAHSDLELREAPNLVKTQLCFRFNSKGRCNKGSFCRFAHGLDELQHVAAAPNGRLNEEPMKVRLPELPLRPPPGLEHLKPLSLLDLETLSCVSTSESTPREEPSGKEDANSGLPMIQSF